MKYKTIKKFNKITTLFIGSVLFIFACFMSTLFSVPDSSLLALTNWGTATSDTTFLSTGDGTISNPYKISTEEQLATVSRNISTLKTKSFKLIKNLDISKFTWIPIGTSANYFSGTFDGGGYTISGIRIDATLNLAYAGLFGYLIGATVNNLTVVDEINTYVVSKTSLSSSYAGAFAGYAENSNFENILNFNVDVYSLSKTLRSYAGGIVGQSYNTRFYNVVNMGNVYSLTGSKLNNSYAGGICGYSYSNNFIYTRNDGEINSYYSTTFATYKPLNLSTYDSTPGPIPVDEFSTKTFAGGIVGYCESSISLSYNTSDIDAGNNTVILNVAGENMYATSLPLYSYAGGISGYTTGSVTKVYNTGNVTSNACTVASSSGQSLITSSTNLTEVDNHYFTVGSTSIRTSSGYNKNLLYLKDIGTVKLYTTKSYAGGIAGFSSNGISNAYNDGTISGGGIQKNLKLSAEYDLYTSMTYIGSPTVSTLSSLYYYLNITYFDTTYYGAISGNRSLVNSNTYGSSPFLNFDKILNGACYDLGVIPSGHTLSILENYDLKNQTFFYPPTNELEQDLFMNGNPVTYINNIRFTYNISRNNNNVVVNFSTNATFYFRINKNIFGFFTDSTYSYTNVQNSLFSSGNINQNINHTIKMANSIQVSELGSEWSKVSDKNGNRPYLTNFYW